MIYAYIRVSTNHQDGENQKIGIEKLASERKLIIDSYIDDSGQSGTVEPEKRGLGELMKVLKSGDILITSELSRLGRSLFMIMRILEFCMTNGVKVYTVKEGYELGDNIQSKVLAFAFGLSAEIERELISQRTREALQRRKAEGKKLGREKGKRCHLNYKCSERHTEILNWISEGVTRREISKRLGVSVNALYRYLTYTGIHTPKRNGGVKWEGGVYR
ncbi:MAG: recombinase family protein [Treponema sp.]|nr:recombinase family protein [Treponema sp.]